ncbi:uncharacterized protein FIESC28_10349 [Fusarium coffeatum]|uniref:Uncharacterized protein n=1 Tax=Fusarium coffeatum TaxID=231269 RepID=A0A366QTH6_9HYPO|nr:uncharacterized protein FIESC28_10349 [Fusarium coffeatum]RBR08157.1 hypothetical protein FIESC28_10349 [Fusarium coffeatum]
MLSLRYHILNWALSLMTIPLAMFRKSLVNSGLMHKLIDDIHCPAIGLTIYFLTLWLLKARETAKQEQEQETHSDQVAFSGNVAPAELEAIAPADVHELEAEVPISTNTNGNCNGNGNARSKKRRKRGKKGNANGKQNRNSSSHNGKAQQFNGNRIPPRNKTPAQDTAPSNTTAQLNAIAARRLRNTSIGRIEYMKQSVIRLIEQRIHVLYPINLVLLFTSDELPGLGAYSESRYCRMAARVLVTFTILGTVEPWRRTRWDIEMCGLGMLTYCCAFCGQGPSPWASITMGAISLSIVGSIIELLLCLKTGRWICWPSLWLASDIGQFDTLVRISALSPLIDIVETAIYAITPYVVPAWYQSRRDLMEKPL